MSGMYRRLSGRATANSHLEFLCTRKSALERKLHFFDSSEYRGTKLRILPNIPRSQIFSEIKHLISSFHSVVIYQELEPNVNWIHILWSQCGVIPLVLIHNTVLIHNIVRMQPTWKHGYFPEVYNMYSKRCLQKNSE